MPTSPTPTTPGPSENRSTAPSNPGAAPDSPVTARRLLHRTILPTLRRLGFKPRDLVTEAALMLGTAGVESALRHRMQIGGGPGRGLWQVEEATHTDNWANWLAFRPDTACAVLTLLAGDADGHAGEGGPDDGEAGGDKDGEAADLLGEPQRPPHAVLITHDRYGCDMARVWYRRRPGWPHWQPGQSSAALAQYWKAQYNTPGGAGTPARFMAAFEDPTLGIRSALEDWAGGPDGVAGAAGGAIGGGAVGGNRVGGAAVGRDTVGGAMTDGLGLRHLPAPDGDAHTGRPIRAAAC